MGYLTRENNYGWGSDIPFSLPERGSQVEDAMQFQKFFLKHSAYAGKWWVGEVWRKTNEPAAWMGVINVRYCDNYADALAELRDRLHDLRGRLLCSPDD